MVLVRNGREKKGDDQRDESDIENDEETILNDKDG